MWFNAMRDGCVWCAAVFFSGWVGGWGGWGDFRACTYDARKWRLAPSNSARATSSTCRRCAAIAAGASLFAAGASLFAITGSPAAIKVAPASAASWSSRETAGGTKAERCRQRSPPEASAPENWLVRDLFCGRIFFVWSGVGASVPDRGVHYWVRRWRMTTRCGWGHLWLRCQPRLC